jgi:hypothetical protein
MTANLNVVNGLVTYGNFGGPGWSGGERVSGVMTEAQRAVVPKDVLDALFKEHDTAYDDASLMTDPANQAKAILEADMALVGGMLALDPESLDVLGKDYREAALDLFDKKLVADFLYWQGVKLSSGLPTLPSMTYDDVQKWGAEYSRRKGIIPQSNTAFAASKTIAPARRDPLILDLDNDGLETIGINPTTPILFDHDADGVKTATGWVNPDDAFLVLDRNGNNTIDSGKELFGDATALYAGGTAADGFAALAQEDTNHDGLVNASDARFASLRLWRDLNQDGISQAGELFTLASQGITALNVASTANSQLLANGNQIADLGGFVRTDGSSGTLGAVEQLADVNLASNPFYSEFTDHIPLTEAAQNMADMQGAGQVRNLREAASLQTAQGSALASALTAFSAATTRSGQMAQLDSLLKTWAETSSMATTASGAFAGVSLSVTFAGVSTGSPAWQTWMDKLSILERFNGQTFMAVPAAGTTLAIDFFSTREVLLDAAYTALKESVYGALVMQTRLKPYLDQISLSIGESGIALDFSAMEAVNDFEWRVMA